jgi:3-oxoadipate enol-lactonase
MFFSFWRWAVRRLRGSALSRAESLGVRIQLDGAQFDVLDEGRGPALVLLHGFPLSKETWDEQAAALAPLARVIRFDLRGLGSTTATPGPYLMEQLAGDLLEVLDALGVDRAVVAGHSLGGYVALAFYRMFAERCAGLGLVASRFSADTAERATLRLALAERAERDGMAPVAAALLPALFAPQVYSRGSELVARAAATIARTDPRGAAAMLRGMAARIDSRDLLAEMELPVTLLAGREDALVPLEELEEATAALPDATLEVLPHGHMLPAEDPAAVSAALARLIARAAAVAP